MTVLVLEISHAVEISVGLLGEVEVEVNSDNSRGPQFITPIISLKPTFRANF